MTTQWSPPGVSSLNIQVHWTQPGLVTAAKPLSPSGAMGCVKYPDFISWLSVPPVCMCLSICLSACRPPTRPSIHPSVRLRRRLISLPSLLEIAPPEMLISCFDVGFKASHVGFKARLLSYCVWNNMISRAVHSLTLRVTVTHAHVLLTLTGEDGFQIKANAPLSWCQVCF